MSTTLDGQRPTSTEPSADEFADRLLGAIRGAQFVQTAYLGDRLGYYRALAAGGPLTSGELASRTGTAERYAREWLEHQAVTGVVTVDDPDAAPEQRRFELPAGPAEALTDPTSPAHLLPMARMVCGLGKHLDALVGAYRSGGGVSWAEFGEDVREGQGGPTDHCSSARSPTTTSRPSPRSRVCCPAAGSPTSAAGSAGRRSGSRWPTPM